MSQTLSPDVAARPVLDATQIREQHRLVYRQGQKERLKAENQTNINIVRLST